MKESPILFSAPMVKALLENRKSQTRRVVSPQNSKFGSAPTKLYWQHADFAHAWVDGRTPSDGAVLQYLHVPCHAQKEGDCSVCDERGWTGSTHRLWPKWWPHKAYAGSERERPPHRLWVRESFAVQPDLWESSHGPQPIHYLADVTDRMQIEDYVGKPSIHMPRWASRITLEITDVRVQRLQEISEEDAKAEGAPGGCTVCGDSENGDCIEHTPSYIDGFAGIWMKINGDESWWSNPWIWALSFRRIP